jgi:hypothetical protein
MWKSQTQKSVTLFVKETTKEIKFIEHVLESIGIQVEKTFIGHIDNVRAIFFRKCNCNQTCALSLH